MTVLRSVELSADLISEVVDRIREAGIEFTYDTGETTVVPMTGPRWPTTSPIACSRGLRAPGRRAGDADRRGGPHPPAPGS